MSGLQVPTIKVVGSAVNSGSTVSPTVTVTNTNSTTSRMLVPAVLIPNADGTSSFAQFIPGPSHGQPKCQPVSTSTNFQPLIIGNVSQQSSNSVLGLLTPVLASDKNQALKMNSPQAILPAPKLNNPHGVMHAVLPQKTKFKFFSNKAALAAASQQEVIKGTATVPPPLQPISTASHQIINLNKLKQLGGQFKRIQPIQPHPGVLPSVAEILEQVPKESPILRVQIKQGSSLAELKHYTSKGKVEVTQMCPEGEIPEAQEQVEQVAVISEAPQQITNVSITRIKEVNSECPNLKVKEVVNEFPNLITIHGLTSDKQNVTSEALHVTSSDPQKVASGEKNIEVFPQDDDLLCSEQIVEPLSYEAPVVESATPAVETCEASSSSQETNPEKTVEADSEDKECGDKPSDDLNPKKMIPRQFKRPSILGGRKKTPVSSPVLASGTTSTNALKVNAILKRVDLPLIALNSVVKPEAALPDKSCDTVETTVKSSQEVKSCIEEPSNKANPESAVTVDKSPLVDESATKPVTEEFDPAKLLDWQDGVGVLPGSNFKFMVNEFGIMEMVEGSEEKTKESEKVDPPKSIDNMPLKSEQPSTSKETVEAAPVTKTIVGEVKKRSRKEKLSPDDIYCCENCGCYGMACEFKSQRFCSDTCEEATSKRRAAIGRRAIELEELRLKRRRRRQKEIRLRQKGRLLPGGTVESGGDSPSSSPEFPEDAEKAGTPATTATPSSTAQNSPSQSPAISDDEANSSDGQVQISLLPWQVLSSSGEAQFSWPKYLEHLKARAVPTKLFPDSGFPYQRNGFRPGMRLEGIDPRTPSQFCALSVVDVRGYRIKLHFEGWPDTNDFWVNADSRDIFTIGFCEKSGRSLIPPRGYPKSTFSWSNYLKLLHGSAAPRQLFLHRTTTKNAVGPSGFRVGMKLEAVDRQNHSLVCVATVADILDGRLLVHFDSWDHSYDYWVEPTSPYIHPVGWCEQQERSLTPPNGYNNFNWETYLKETKSAAVPSRAFKPKPSPAFKKGMKLECVDPRFPELIRVSTINDSKEHRVQVNFDGWPIETAVWLDADSPDIHPMGWCTKTGHPLTPPPGPNQEHQCVTPGCRALLKNSQFILPHNSSSCPLSSINLSKAKKLPVREDLIKAVPKVESSDGEEYKPDWEEDYEDIVQPEEKIVEPPAKKKKLEPPVSLGKSLRLDVHESIFSPGYSPSPAEVPINWAKQAELLNIDSKKCLNIRVARAWTPLQVQNFVSSLPGCADRSKVFVEEKIDGESLLLLTQSDLISLLGFKVGPAIKLFSSITLLKHRKRDI